MMVMFQLMLLMMPQYSEASEVLYFLLKDIVYIGYCVSVTVECVCVVVSVCILYTCRNTHIDAYTWALPRMTDGKVALWIVKVNVIKSSCCFDSIY